MCYPRAVCSSDHSRTALAAPAAERPRQVTRAFGAALGVWACLLFATGHADGRPGAGTLPAKFKKPPYSIMSLSVGHPNAGRQLRAKRLKPRGYLKIKKGSASAAWGHPALVKMLYRAARDISRATKGSVMVVGDLSKKGGGPLAGHGSHQSGRDADLAFYVTNAKGKPIVPKRFVAFGADGKAKDRSGLRFDDWRNWLLVQSWLRDHRAGISHIFVSRPLRRRLLDFARSRPAFRKYLPEAERLLKQPEDSSAHDDHFHVRISCPKRQEEICREHPR